MGQKTKRGAITSIAGSRVSIATIAEAMPIAPIGPRLEVELSSARERHRSAAITVPPEARIAGPAPLSATPIAWERLSTWRNSSRYLAMSSNA